MRVDERTEVIRELLDAADDFAARALAQEARRDGARPGTGAHHQFAHSATLWRAAEQSLRARIEELELASATRRTRLGGGVKRPLPGRVLVRTGRSVLGYGMSR